MILRPLVIAIVFQLLLVLPAQAEIRIETFHLKNGMEVIVVPNHRVPAVSHTIWYKVGAGDDPEGKSGLSHYLEHMMFQGTKRFPDDAYSRTISALGGQNNAFTGHDFTAYYVNIARDKLPQVMDMEANRMRNLNPLQDDFSRERDVIIEERRLTLENKPVSVLSEQMDAALYLNHPYHISVIGYKHEMAGLTGEDVMAHYRKFYHPANALLVVAGDITAKQLKPLAEKYYGGITPGKKVKREWTSEPPQIAERRVVLRDANVTQAGWYRNYLAPSLVTGETKHAIPLSVLAQIWGGGETSRFYQSLVVKQKLAVAAGASYSAVRRGPSELSFYALPTEGTSMNDLEKAMEKEIADALASTPSEAEITRAKTQLKAEEIFARDSLEGVAQQVGAVRTLGLSLDYITGWPAMVEAVTVPQMMEAAKAVILPEASVTGWLMPKETVAP